MEQTKKIDDYLIYLSEKLGEGSFGKVYSGLKISTNLPVAIKIIGRGKWYQQQYQFQELMNEVKIMRSLNHTNIIQCFDYFRTENNFYIIEELGDCDLASYLQHNKQNLTEAMAIQILKQICSGCLYLIQKGIVHRDLKPQNIMLCKGIWKIGDFGRAKRNITKNILNTSLVGTPGYMAPEVMQKDNYSSKCDIWSIGVIFYQILHAKLPWNGRNFMQIRQNTEKVFLEISTKKFNKVTVDFIMKALRLKEVDRFGWEQMFSHEIFGNKFKFYTEYIKQLQIQHNIFVRQTNKELIEFLKIKNALINFEQFKHFLTKMGFKLSHEQITYSFQSLDFDGNGLISWRQVQKATLKLRNKQEAQKTQKRLFSSEELIQMVFKILLKIKEKCNEQKCSQIDIFYKFGSNSTLKINEFENLLASLGIEFNAQALQTVFSYFDRNNQRMITLKIFIEIYNRCTQGF